MKINSFRLNRIKVWEPSQAWQARAMLDVKRLPSPRVTLWSCTTSYPTPATFQKSRTLFAFPYPLQVFTFSLTLQVVVSSHLYDLFLFLPGVLSSPALFDASPREPSFSPLLARIIIFNNVSKYFCPAVKVKARKVGAKNGGDGARSFWWTRLVRPGSDNPFYLGRNFQWAWINPIL